MKKIIIIISSLLLVAVAAGGIYYYYMNRHEQKINMVTVMPQHGYIAKSVTATGAVEPVDTVTVGAQISGLVSKVLVDFNSIVKKGQLLAQIDPTIMEAATEEAKANLVNANSNLAFQKSNYDRQNQLFQLGAISKADYQIALNQYESAKANVDNAKGGVKQDQHVSFTVDAFPDDIFKGTVNEIQLHPSVSANVVTYPTIIAVDNKAMKLKPGMTASVNIYTQEDSNALLIPSKAVSFKPDSAALKGYKIIRAEKIMPKKNSAVSGNNQNNRKAFVWIKSGDTLIEKMITIGLNDDTHIEVLKGLTENDEVIVGTSNAEVKSVVTDNTQRSPFMPQMQQKKTDSAAKK